jgi:hypothetical protein
MKVPAWRRGDLTQLRHDLGPVQQACRSTNPQLGLSATQPSQSAIAPKLSTSLRPTTVPRRLIFPIKANFSFPPVLHGRIFPAMPNQPAAPSEADAPRPWARAILHAQIPAALKLLLLALLGVFSKAEPTARTRHLLRQDWLFSTSTDFADDLDSAQNPYALKRILQLRAEIGWLLRGTPNRGMPLSGRRAPKFCPAPSARAPP